MNFRRWIRCKGSFWELVWNKHKMKTGCQICLNVNSKPKILNFILLAMGVSSGFWFGELGNVKSVQKFKKGNFVSDIWYCYLPAIVFLHAFLRFSNKHFSVEVVNCWMRLIYYTFLELCILTGVGLNSALTLMKSICV